MALDGFPTEMRVGYLREEQQERPIEVSQPQTEVSEKKDLGAKPREGRETFQAMNTDMGDHSKGENEFKHSFSKNNTTGIEGQ